jgi:hypothetical protein
MAQIDNLALVCGALINPDAITVGHSKLLMPHDIVRVVRAGIFPELATEFAPLILRQGLQS